MNSKINLIVFAVLMVFGFSSSGQTVQWAKKGISEGFENGNALVVDDSGNVYVTGQIEFSSVFDNYTLNTYGQHDIVVAKYSTDGTIKWIKKAGGRDGDIGNGIGIDANHNVYVTGEFEEVANFGNGVTLTSDGANDGFVVKYDANGNTVWAKRFGTIYSEKGRALAVSPSGNVYITGNFSGSSDFGSTTLNSYGGNDIFVAKLNTNGNFLWAKKAGGGNQDRGYGIALDKNEDVYVTGTFTGSASFSGTTLSNSANGASFIAKYSSSGSLIWAKESGACCDTTKSNSIALDENGNIYIAGSFADKTEFDSYHFTSRGVTDIFLTKYDPNGNVIWSKQAGGADEDVAYGVTVDTLNHLVYVTGFVRAHGTFDQFPFTIAGYKDIFVAAYNMQGAVQWMRLYGGTQRDLGSAVAVDPNGNIYTTGLFNGTAFFDGFTLTGYPNQPWADFYVNKISPAVATFPSVQSAITNVAPGQCSDLVLTLQPGNGDRRLVTARINTSLTGMPINGTNYAADPVFGNGADLGNGNFVVYAGSGDSIVVTGLTAGSTYTFTVFEYNGYGITTNYNVNTPGVLSATAPTLTLQVAGLQSYICSGEALHLQANGAVTYSWAPASGLSAINGSQVIASPQSTTMFTVSGYTAANCYAESNFLIEVKPRPNVAFSALSSVCANSTPVQLQGGSPAGGTYSGSGVSNNTFYPGLTRIGTSILRYQYTDANGCSDIAQSAVTVKSVTTASMRAIDPVCENSPYLLLTHGQPLGGTYSGNGVSGNVFNPSIGTGSHSVYYSFTNSQGCTSTATRTAVVNPAPFVNLGSDMVTCVGTIISLSAGSGLNSYLWSTGATGNSILVDNSGVGVGNKSVSVRVTNSYGCENTDTINILFDLCSGIHNSHDQAFRADVYPNPFNDRFRISTDRMITLCLYDVSGRLLERLENVTGTLSAGEDLKPGLYFLTITDSRNMKTYSIVKSE